MNPSRLPDPGDIVRIRDEPWRVLRRTRHATTIDLEVVALGSAGRPRSSHFLLPFDRWEPLPSETRARVVRPAAWRRVARRVLADATPAWSSLGSVANARLTLIPFQLEPAMALVRRLACRFLIADAVGLGKTIQAGLMVAETLARTADGRALIVAPAGLREQWVGELEDRFDLEPALLDGATVGRATERPAGTSPWDATRLIVTSIDYVKRPEVMRALEGLVWDLVVFDEAHALTGRSDRATAATALAERSRAVVMLSATPHSGDQSAFERLRALGDLRGAFPLMVFRRPRSALGPVPPRHVRMIRVQPTEAERAMHASLDAYAGRARRESRTDAAHLAISVLLRRASSSATSLATSVERRLRFLSGAGLVPHDEGRQPALPFGGEDGDDAPGDELSAPALADRETEIACLDGILRLARMVGAESKWTALARYLARVGDTAIVFTQYRDTLATLARRLGESHAELHGGLTHRERREQAHRFTHGDARFLLATDAASEGLNLQRRCRLVIHLEMPWTPVRIEQRVGRVDRLGQTRSVHSVHLIAAGTSEERVAARVVARAHDAERGLSDAEDACLGLDDPTPVGDACGGIPGSGSPPGGAAVAPDVLQHECRRIERARILDTGAAAGLPGRPVVTAIRRGTRAFALRALRLPFLDSADSPVWDALIALELDGTVRGDRVRLLGPLTIAERTVLDLTRATHLAALRAELQPVIESMLARDRAIADAIGDRRARLAARLLQPGLFERRVERAVSAQDHMLLAALARLAARRVTLTQRRAIHAAQAVPVFGVVFGR